MNDLGQIDTAQEEINDLSFQDLDMEAKEDDSLESNNHSTSETLDDDFVTNSSDLAEHLYENSETANGVKGIFSSKSKVQISRNSNAANNKPDDRYNDKIEYTADDKTIEKLDDETYDQNDSFETNHYLNYVTKINRDYSNIQFNQREYSINLSNVLKTQKRYKKLLKHVCLSKRSNNDETYIEEQDNQEENKDDIISE